MLILKEFPSLNKEFRSQHFSWSNIVKLIMMLIIQPSFQFHGIVFDSSIDLGKVLTVELTSAGALTTLP